ncbi:ceramidase [Vararia minispora EC-137]|uniref:Ceramidase n=1 Tax=Vararia minispora EC-137 TaxID=1314806 RepID=A0ACB8QR14_9AGAM|nr:ceramidase [Vararia minispora EC-137]
MSLKEGVWGPVTATLDWCEENYQFSDYIAECANTFSNIITIWFAVYGARAAAIQGLPALYITSLAGLGLVGIGSFAFHATLLYEAQMADELPMIYCASWALFVMLDTVPGPSNASRRWSLLAGTVLFDVFFTISYYFYRNPAYHQIVFACLLLSTAMRTVYITRFSSAARHIPDAKKKEANRLYTIGAGLFAFGFLIWNLDNAFCNVLTGWKRSIGWPAGFLLEGHSWWHVFTVRADYCPSLLVKDRPDAYEIAYHSGLPVVRRTETKAKPN